jgi:hypothetical protein
MSYWDADESFKLAPHADQYMLTKRRKGLSGHYNHNFDLGTAGPVSFATSTPLTTVIVPGRPIDRPPVPPIPGGPDDPPGVGNIGPRGTTNLSAFDPTYSDDDAALASGPLDDPTPDFSTNINISLGPPGNVVFDSTQQFQTTSTAASLFAYGIDPIPVGETLVVDVRHPATDGFYDYNAIIQQRTWDPAEFNIFKNDTSNSTTLTITPLVPNADWSLDYWIDVVPQDGSPTTTLFFRIEGSSIAGLTTNGIVKNFQDTELLPILGATLVGTAGGTGNGRSTIFINGARYPGKEVVVVTNDGQTGPEESFIYYFLADTNTFEEVRIVFENDDEVRTGDCTVQLTLPDGTQLNTVTVTPTRAGVTWDLSANLSSLQPGWNRLTLSTTTNATDFLAIKRLRTQIEDGKDLTVVKTFAGVQRRNPGLPGIGDGQERIAFTGGNEVAIFDIPPSNISAIDGDLYVALNGGLDFQRESDQTWLTILGSSIGQDFEDAVERIPPDYIWADLGVRVRRTPGGQGRLNFFVQPISQ